jgi:hypothetical protein
MASSHRYICVVVIVLGVTRTIHATPGDAPGWTQELKNFLLVRNFLDAARWLE